MRQLTIHGHVATALFIAVSSTALRGQDLAGGSFLRENLDLPYNSGGRAGEEEEEEAPEVVVFYGQTYETDATFFCLDQSLSMGGGEWEALQAELTRVVTEFSSAMEFGIVFFHEEATVFPGTKRPARASPAMKQAAIAMVKGTSASDQSTCFLSGLREALRMANRCTVQRKTIIFMSDGKATCTGEDTVTYVQKTLSEVKGLNTKKATINTVGIGFEVIEYFLKSLAEQNGGRYERLRRT